MKRTLAVLLFFLLISCTNKLKEVPLTATATLQPATPTPQASVTPTPLPTSTQTPTPTQTPTITPSLTLAALPAAELEESSTIAHFGSPDSGIAFDVQWSADGRSVAVGSHSGYIIYNPKNWDTKDFRLGANRGVLRLAWYPDGRRFLAAGWGLIEYTVGAFNDKAYPAYITWDVALQPGGELMAYSTSANLSNEIIFLESEQGGPSLPMAALISDQGDYLRDESGNLYIALGSLIVIYDTRTDSQVFATTIPGDTHALAWSPDGLSLAYGTNEGVMFMDAKGNMSTLVLPMPAGIENTIYPISDLEYSPDGTRLAAAGISVPIWDSSSRELIKSLQQEPVFTWALSWSPDGRTLATANNDWTVSLWNSTSGELLETLRGYKDIVWGLDWSPDGTRLASVDRSGQLLIWEFIP